MCFVAAIALLSGCATTPRPSELRVNLDAQCADDIAVLPARQLALPAAKEHARFMDFVDVGQCLQTGTQRVATALFALPDVARPARVDLTIQAHTAATLAAAVTLLDAQRQPVRRHGFEEWVRRGNTFTLDLFLNDADRKVAYLLLTPDTAWVGKKDESVRGGTSTIMVPVGVALLAFNSGYEAKSQRELTDTGSVRIEVKSLAPALPAVGGAD